MKQDTISKKLEDVLLELEKLSKKVEEVSLERDSLLEIVEDVSFKRDNAVHNPILYCRAQWWRGGKMARLLCDWESLPRESLIKVARIGSGEAIPGLLYNDSNAVPQRAKQCARRARIKASSNIAEIGLQFEDVSYKVELKSVVQSWSLAHLVQSVSKARSLCSLQDKCILRGITVEISYGFEFE